MLKKKNWLVVIMVVFFGIFFQKPVSAADSDYCTPKGGLGCSITDSSDTCSDKGFDCDNQLPSSRSDCVRLGGCYEERECPRNRTSMEDTSILTYCYLSKTTTIPPDECGYIGRKCCKVNSKDVCTHEGIPATVNYSCICQKFSDTFCDLDDLDGTTGSGINTAIGCIPIEMREFVPWLMTWLFGIAGGIAFLLMVYGFILIATSSGDEKKIQGAKETITSAIIGLLVCIFSVFILRLVAINILKIPGIS